MKYLYIHLGGETVIRSKDVIAILNSNTESAAKKFEQFLEGQRKIGNPIIEISKNLVRSIVITDRAIYLSPISSLTLKGRS